MDSYTVQAVLTLKDNLSAGMRNAAASTESLGSKFKSAIGLGSAMQIGMSAVRGAMSAVSSSIDDAVSRYDQLNNFPKVMNNLGISAKDSSAALKELDDGISGLPTTLNSATQGVTRFVSVNGDIKKSTRYFLAMNNAIAAGGAAADIQASAVEQLAQSYSKGKMDMIEWRSLQTAMPAQLNMVAKAMGKTTDTLGEGLRNGSISMDEFMDTMVKLNDEGIDGMASFADQAQVACGGIATAFTNLKTGVTKGVTTCIAAIDEMLEQNGLPTIAEAAIIAKGKIIKAFDAIASVIKQINLKGIIEGLTPAFEVLKKTAAGVAKPLKAIAKWANKNAEGLSSLVPVILAGIAAFKGYKKISSWLAPLTGATETFDRFGNSSKKASKASVKLKEGLGSLAKNAGIALIIGSLAGLALALKPLASLGTTAVAPLMSFAAAISAVAVVLSETGKKLQSSMKGVIAFAASVSAMALAMAPLASTGLEGAAAIGAFGAVVSGLVAVVGIFGSKLQSSIGGILAFGAAIGFIALAMGPIANAGEAASKNMIVFGGVIAGLVAVFAIFGSALEGAMIPMVVFAAVVLAVGAALKIATPFIEAFTDLIKQLGETVSTILAAAASAVSQFVSAICDGFSTICDAVATVIDAISGGFATVLDAVANVIDSIGNSAKKAGTGFKSVAEGIQMIAGLSLWDISKSLAAVAVGMGQISSKGKNLSEVASGMQSLVMSLALAAANIAVFNAAMMTFANIAQTAQTSVIAIKEAFAGFVITPPDISLFIAAFAAITAMAQQLVPALTAAGMQAGLGLASGLSAGASQASAAVAAAAAGVSVVLSALAVQLGAIGKTAGINYSNGLKAGLLQALSASRQIVGQISTTLRSAQSGAYSAGRYIGIGLANGMLSQVGAVRAAAAQLASAAKKAIEAKAKIGSPSKVTDKLGRWYGTGWVNGIASKVRAAKRAAEKLVDLPQVRQPSIAAMYGGSGTLSDDYTYGIGGGTYVIEVPVMLEGREVSRVTAPFMQSDLNKLNTRESRKRGKR